MPILMPFCDAHFPPNRIRGSYVYGLGVDTVCFGTIQGIDMGHKAMLFGVLPVKPNNAFDHKTEWIVEWHLTDNAEDFLKIVQKDACELYTQAFELVEYIEAQPWRQRDLREKISKKKDKP